MAWATVIAQADSDSSPWLAVILAALGSSAVGGVVGGFITTWYRGRFERKEAWRSRLIEAADTFATAHQEALISGTTVVSKLGRQATSAIRTADGGTSEWATALADEFIEKRTAAVASIGRLELLFGTDSLAVAEAWTSATALREAVFIAFRSERALEKYGLDPDDREAIGAHAQGQEDIALDSHRNFVRAAASVITSEPFRSAGGEANARSRMRRFW